MTEDDLQQHVVHLMRSHGRPDVCWFAVANGEKRSLATGAKLKRQGVQPGAPDLVFVVDGVFHGVELKTLTGRASEAQLAFGHWITAADGVYHVCHGLDESFRLLKEIGCLLPGVRLTYPTSPAEVRSRAVKLSSAPRK